MAVNTAFKRAALRALWLTAQRTRTSLADAFECALGEAFALQTSGQIIQSTAGNGESVTFSKSGGGWTAATAVEVYGEFLDRYETSQAALESGATDCQIYDHMLARLDAAREVYKSFEGMCRP